MEGGARRGGSLCPPVLDGALTSRKINILNKNENHKIENFRFSHVAINGNNTNEFLLNNRKTVWLFFIAIR